MIKKIGVSELRIGMYIHDLNSSWMNHPFLSKHFLIKDNATIQRIANAGIRSVAIDTSKGKDLEDSAPSEEISSELQQQISKLPKENKKEASHTVESELQKAKALFREATTVIRNLMEDARVGKQVELASVDPIVERMVQSVFRNQHALTGISRIKTKDEYTFMHCVSVAGLLVSFARDRGFSEDDIHHIALGGLIHDVGKTMIPDSILNKPDRLNPDEFRIIQGHVDHSRDILQNVMGLDKTAMDIALMHHERIDGTGYPLGLKDDQISIIGKMSAIVDVYDALTSVRVYKDNWEPTEALKKLVEWSPDHFDPELVQHFIRCLGIYPVGSLVETESGLLGIVLEPGNDLLRPTLRIIYSTKYSRYEKVHDINLEKAKTDRIIQAVNPNQYHIDLRNFF